MRIKFNSLFETVLLETHYDKKAAEVISKSGLFDEKDSDDIIQLLSKEKIHAFNHAPSYLDKYLKGIARMIVEESNGDQAKAKEFILNSAKVFDTYLTYVKEIHDKQEDKVAFDNKFINEMSYQEVKNFVDNYQKELDQKSKEELKNMEFSDSSNYELIPINNWDEFNEQFGGNITGDGESDGYAGDGHGGTAWCHANNESVYNNWTEHGEKFFVLARKDYMDIPFDSKTNTRLDGKDDYGNSLIAILVDKYGNLNRATLRCNHVGVYTDADNQYKTFADLSKLAGFNVEEKVHELGTFEEDPVKDGIYYYNDKKDLYLEYTLKQSIKKVIIDGCIERIPSGIFQKSKSLKEVEIQEGVYRVGTDSFSYCYSLETVKFPRSLKDVYNYAFFQDSKLTSIDISNVDYIGEGAFKLCTTLSNVYLGDDLSYLGSEAFSNCYLLKEIKLPDSLRNIDSSAFEGCRSLQVVTLPKNLRNIFGWAFQGTAIKSITIPALTEFIGNGAFRSCSDLKTVTILSKDIFISQGAFAYCPDDLTIRCYRGSAADNYCTDSEINCEYI